MIILFTNHVWQIVITFIFLVVSSAPTASLDSIIAANSLTSITGSITRVSAVIGGEVDLPCDTRPPLRNDSLLIVVWYRDDNPVYSFDARMSGPTAHWMDESIMNRARWKIYPLSALQMSNIQSSDRSIYQCRVDFQVSPTKNYKVALDVIEVPNKPVIFDERGKEISGIAGPYFEGGNFKLICTVTGGNPTPRVQWLQGDTVLTTLNPAEEVGGGDTRTLTLVVQNATRAHLLSIYSCVADNTLLSTPQRTSVRVELYLKPSTVEILSREQPLSDGKTAELQCRSTGARPPAVITWWLGNKQLNAATTKYQDVKNSNETVSILHFTPLKEHNGQILTCRAVHPKLNHSGIETKLPLNIGYVPVANMQLGAKMNPNDIEEGDDVYFSCEVDANPPAYKVVWEHNGVQLSHNAANGMILTGNSLALRKVSRHQAGQYTCVASNVEGDGRSYPLTLQIVFRPVCRRKEMKMIGAALQEPTTVICEIESYPAPDSFEWVLNNSAGSIKVDPRRFQNDEKIGRSVLTYTPLSDSDYGTLSCRAINMAGQQMIPCIYTLLPATRPDPPTNCTVYNLTHDSLDLLCLSGYDGGLECVYITEVWANEGLVVNASNAVALWNLRRLGAKRQLKIIVYAANARGRSEPVIFTVETTEKLSPRTEAQEAWEVNWAVGGVLGAAVTIALVFCLAFIAAKIKHRERNYEVTVPTSKVQKAAVSKRNSPQGNDDRNPDLIPLSKCVVDCPPEPPPYAEVAHRTEPKSSSSAHSLARIAQTPSTPLTPHSLSDSSSKCGLNGTIRSHREVVTTRTPLLAGHQESCV